MLIVLPLGSSNLSIVLMSIIIVIPQVTINSIRPMTNNPANIGAVKKESCSWSVNFPLEDVQGWAW